MALITVTDLTFGYDGSYDLLFEQASFQFDTNWHLGFLGRNGRGKTTFLQLLLGKLEYRGRISAPVDLAYFPFPVENPSFTGEEIAETICPGRPRWQLLREMGLLELEEGVLYRPFDTLSGGEQTKLLLCALFLREDRYLLIDEPTNHLDLHGREVLSRYLRKKQGFLLVSHDRAFLDGCIDHVLSLNKASIEVQRGNYSSWEENRRRRDEFEQASNERLKKEISRLQKTAREKAQWSDRSEREKIGFDPAKTEKSMGRRPYLAAQAKKSAKRAKAIRARQEATIEEKSKLLKDIQRTDALKIPALAYRAERLGEITELSIDYGNGPLFPPLSFALCRGERIALQGANGTGKSSILKLLCGLDIPFQGKVQLGQDVVISYVPQNTDFLRGSLQDFMEAQQLDATLFLAILRKLNFSREQFEKPLERYSAGQKKKVLIAQSLCTPAHLYIWDEPLNYIDLLSRGQIEDLLAQYHPTLIFVEHDRVFCDKIANKFIQLK